jgi:hypothetical protein
MLLKPELQGLAEFSCIHIVAFLQAAACAPADAQDPRRMQARYVKTAAAAAAAAGAVYSTVCSTDKTRFMLSEVVLTLTAAASVLAACIGAQLCTPSRSCFPLLLVLLQPASRSAGCEHVGCAVWRRRCQLGWKMVQRLLLCWSPPTAKVSAWVG